MVAGSHDRSRKDATRSRMVAMTQKETSQISDADSFADCLRALNRLLIVALRALRDEGQSDHACRIAADAWSVVRKVSEKEAEVLTAALHGLTRSIPKKKESIMSNPQQLDVRDLPPPRRHALIFETCGKLGAGDAVILVNDHDPKPLYYQFQAEYPGRFGWEYVESGPEVWQVRITRQAA